MDERFEDSDDNLNIESVEARIGVLTNEIARCRKLAFIARVLVWSGGATLLLLLLGLIPAGLQTLLIGLCAAIGGIVLAGSNATTWSQTEAALAEAEAMRHELIGRMTLRLVEPTTFH